MSGVLVRRAASVAAVLSTMWAFGYAATAITAQAAALPTHRAPRRRPPLPRVPAAVTAPARGPRSAARRMASRRASAALRRRRPRLPLPRHPRAEVLHPRVGVALRRAPQVPRVRRRPPAPVLPPGASSGASKGAAPSGGSGSGRSAATSGVTGQGASRTAATGAALGTAASRARTGRRPELPVAVDSPHPAGDRGSCPGCPGPPAAPRGERPQAAPAPGCRPTARLWRPHLADGRDPGRLALDAVSVSPTCRERRSWHDVGAMDHGLGSAGPA